MRCLRYVLVFSALILNANVALADRVKIAVIDTGLDLADPRFGSHLCPAGHKDFTGTGLMDTAGHGTHIAGLITLNAGQSPYCLLILKYYREDDPSGNLTREVEALRYAIAYGANIVNFSSGGSEFSEPEYLTIKSAPSVTFMVAAGNNGVDIDVPAQEYYPAGYPLPNVIPVGNLRRDGYRVRSSNWGKRVRHWEMGDQVSSTWPGGKLAIEGGTSQATALATGLLVSGKLRRREPKDSQCTSNACPYPAHTPAR